MAELGLSEIKRRGLNAVKGGCTAFAKFGKGLAM
jgi:hypothetical protein